MENDSNIFLTHFLKKIVALKSVAIDLKNSRDVIITEIDKLIQYCRSDTSLNKLKLFQAFFHEAFTYDDECNKNFNLFMIHLKLDCGHFYTKIIKKDGQVYELPIVRSMSFGECNEKDRTAFFEKSKDVIQEKYGIVFNNWFMHWQCNEGTM